MMRAEEFSLVLSWPRTQVPVPGFYVRASFSNEGAAQGVVKDTWVNGSGRNGMLASRSFLVDLAAILYEHGMLMPGITAAGLGTHLADGAEKAQEVALAAKRTQLQRLRDEVARLEQELAGEWP